MKTIWCPWTAWFFTVQLKPGQFHAQSQQKVFKHKPTHFGNAPCWPGEFYMRHHRLVFLLPILARAVRPLVNMPAAIFISKCKAGTEVMQMTSIYTNHITDVAKSVFLQPSAELPRGTVSASMHGLCVWISKALKFYAFSFDKPNAPIVFPSSHACCNCCWEESFSCNSASPRAWHANDSDGTLPLQQASFTTLFMIAQQY